jgi:A/G-specific adenine glycosylase
VRSGPEARPRVTARERRLVTSLHTWGAASLRDLPWRRTRDPWAVLVSEAMLQQTQVARVVERYEPFLARFPDSAAMAAAPLADVLDAWAGLGYYRRARDLHRAATAIVERHGGRLPSTLEELVALPGVGAYTARAVLVFALEQDHGVVDTNVARVLARAFTGAPMTAGVVQRLADAVVPTGSAWLHNQAMLDLGATVCTARAPGCDVCPLRSGCAWRRAGGGADGGAGGRTDGVADGGAPDPARSTAGTSRPQAPFVGSDRQGRGRLLAALREVGVGIDASQLDAVTGWGDAERSRRVADALVGDGLAVWDAGALRAPR